MWLMLQQDRPDDYVIATGISHSVQELVEIAFGRVGLDWEKYVRRDPAMLRPAEVEHLLGNATKARTELGWMPTVDFRQLVEMMVDADLKRVASTQDCVARVVTRSATARWSNTAPAPSPPPRAPPRTGAPAFPRPRPPQYLERHGARGDCSALMCPFRVDETRSRRVDTVSCQPVSIPMKVVILAGGLGTRLAEERSSSPSRWSKSAEGRFSGTS